MPEQSYSTLTYNNLFTYQYEFNKIPHAPLTIVYLHGLSSNPWGKKPEAVRTMAQQLGLNFFRFELAGHGIDSAHYDSTDLEVWRNQTVDIIKLNGSIELAPIVGLSEVIVDIVETGSTLRENGLSVLEEICPLSARMVVNQVSMKMENDRISKLIQELRNVI